MTDHLTTEEAANRLGIPTTTFLCRVARMTVRMQPARKVCRSYLWTTAQVDAVRRSTDQPKDTNS